MAMKLTEAQQALLMKAETEWTPKPFGTQPLMRLGLIEHRRGIEGACLWRLTMAGLQLKERAEAEFRAGRVKP